MSLDTYFGTMTVGDLCNKAQISVTTLLERMDDEPVAAPTAVPAKPRPTKTIHKNTTQSSTTSVAKFSKILGNLASPRVREQFDDEVLRIVVAHWSQITIDEIHKQLPWTNAERDQVARAMPRLREAGKIEAHGNTLSRTYTASSN